MDEAGEWSNLNVNEEADFMAQLFPTSNNLTLHYSHTESEYENNGNFTLHYSSDSSNSNYYHQSIHTGPNVVGYYQMDNFTDVSAGPIEFLQCHEEAVEVDGETLEDSFLVEEDVKKRQINDEVVLEIPKGKRNAKGKKKQRLTLGSGDEEEEESEGLMMRRSASSVSLDEDCSSKGGGKTRASRGSATDPQSLYARKRRERINERLKILQTLVPNGTKVDISTMLEEAVQYVKFLQLQIKLLSSDETWMYTPIAYNGMNLGLDLNNISIPR